MNINLATTIQQNKITTVAISALAIGGLAMAAEGIAGKFESELFKGIGVSHIVGGLLVGALGGLLLVHLADKQLVTGVPVTATPMSENDLTSNS